MPLIGVSLSPLRRRWLGTDWWSSMDLPRARAGTAAWSAEATGMVATGVRSPQFTYGADNPELKTSYKGSGCTMAAHPANF